MDPDGRAGKFWQVVGSVTSFVAYNASIFGSMGGAGSQVAGATLNAAGSFAAGFTAILKITSIWKGLENLFSDHHNKQVESAKTTTAGAGDPNWSDKVIKDGDNNIYRYNGSYSGGEYDDTEDYFANLIWEIFQKTSAYKELVNELKKDGYTDVYFIGSTFGGSQASIDPKTGLTKGGDKGETEQIKADDYLDCPQKGSYYLPYPIEKKIAEGAALGRKSIVIRLMDNYTEALADIIQNSPANSETLNVFTFVMEQAIYTLSHEIKAHGLNYILNIEMSAEKEHGVYNHDGKESRGSPNYIEIPLDGKSPSSRDKIEIHQIVLKYKKTWANH